MRVERKGSLALVLICAASAWGADTGSGKRPNIILIMTDDQGYGEISAHGNTILHTPRLDRLRDESVRFTSFHVDPTCSPTRSALMTGRYSSRTGVWHTIAGRSMMRSEEVTLPEYLRGAGYHTAIFGKWHLGDSYPMRPQDQGFEHVFIHGGGGVGQTPDYWGNDYFDDTYFADGEPVPQTGYCTDVWFDHALRYIDAQRREERPFFVYLATNAPHGPYRVEPRYAEAFRQARFEGKPVNAAFYGMIANLDENLGVLLDRLDEWDLARDTIVIFMTDNGSASPSYNAGMRGQKGSPYEGGHRVPCFVRWPAGGIGGGRDIDALAAHIDLVPTLLDLSGVKPADLPPLDGRSLAALLKDPAAAAPERTLFVHSQRIEHPEQWRACAVMTQQYRLVNRDELYDIQADPGQARDLSAAKPEVVSSLREAYEGWWKSISTRFDEYVRIPIGSEAAPVCHLTAHDWHGEVVPWNQEMIAKLPMAQGVWKIDVSRPGRYRFTLSHQPEPFAIELRATKARVRVNEVEGTTAIEPGAKTIEVELDLAAGAADLETFLEADGQPTRGAFFVEVERVKP